MGQDEKFFNKNDTDILDIISRNKIKIVGIKHELENYRINQTILQIVKITGEIYYSNTEVKKKNNEKRFIK